MPCQDVTLDTLLNGRVKLRQYRGGYRFSIDAAILARHIRPRPGDFIVDLGTGCGVVPLVAACRHPDVTAVGVEIQPELAALARENAALNGLSDRMCILEMDMKDLTPAVIKRPPDWVVSNPPYRPMGSGRLNPNSQRALARHEIAVRLDDVAAAAGRILRTGGRFLLMYAAVRLADVFAALRRHRIEPKVLRLVHGRIDAPAKMMLVEGAKAAASGLTAAAPLVVYNEEGAYTAEVRDLLGK